MGGGGWIHPKYVLVPFTSFTSYVSKVCIKLPQMCPKGGRGGGIYIIYYGVHQADITKPGCLHPVEAAKHSGTCRQKHYIYILLVGHTITKPVERIKHFIICMHVLMCLKCFGCGESCFTNKTFVMVAMV